MTDDKYEHEGIDLRPLYEFMSKHLFVRRGSVSGGGNFARALVDAGWGPPAARTEASERFKERRVALPYMCVAPKDKGIETRFGTLCCHPEMTPGSGLCKEHAR